MVALAVGVVALRSLDDDPPLERVEALLESESRFDTSKEAVTGFASAYELLVDATTDFPRDCDVDTGRGRCLGLNQAASWALAFSPASGQCTQPSIQEGRIALLDYVRRSVEIDDAAEEPPPLPPIPNC